MSKKPITVDTSNFDAFAKKIEEAEKNVDQFLEQCAKNLAAVLLRRTMQKTPRDTSNLVRRWTDHGSSLDSKAKNISAEEWAENAEINRKGKHFEITISNPTEYALTK